MTQQFAVTVELIRASLSEEYDRLDGSTVTGNAIQQFYSLRRDLLLLTTDGQQNGCVTSYAVSDNEPALNIPIPCLIADQTIEDASSNALRTICQWLNDAGKKCESVEQLSTFGIRIRTL